jgi:hypothetical protein
MRQTSGKGHSSSEMIVKDIKRAARKQYSAKEKIASRMPDHYQLKISAIADQDIKSIYEYGFNQWGEQ